ncbi:MAG: hypothetical protein IKM20_07835 [Erysipelotrichales bacterium]|nr:hypothetical protein [Erysipelotrichales bacterium]
MNKELFLKQLRFYLSIYFEENEVNDICSDYQVFLLECENNEIISKFGTPKTICNELVKERGMHIKWNSPIILPILGLIIGVIYRLLNIGYRNNFHFIIQLIIMVLPLLCFKHKKTITKSFIIYECIFILHSILLYSLPSLVSYISNPLLLGPIYVSLSNTLYVFGLILILHNLLTNNSSYDSVILTSNLISLCNYIYLLHRLDSPSHYASLCLLAISPCIIAVIICLIHRGVTIWMRK